MYSWILIAHSSWRWVIVVAGLAVLGCAATRLRSGGPWDTGATRLTRFFSIAVDIQVLMGAALYLTLSPLTTVVLASTTTPLPAGSQAHFLAVLHPVIMLAAFIVVHIASVLVRRARSDAARARRALIFYGITWLIVVAGIPWWRPWVHI